jgi:hypothetical protein
VITSPVYAHGVGQLADPCWTIELVKPPTGGDELEAGHWTSREDAEEALPGSTMQDRPAAALRVVQEDFRCTTLILVCGETYVYQGEEDQSHFVDEAHLFSCIPDDEVVQVGPDLFAERLHCDVCAAAIEQREDDPTEVADQQRLLGELDRGGAS